MYKFVKYLGTILLIIFCVHSLKLLSIKYKTVNNNSFTFDDLEYTVIGNSMEPNIYNGDVVTLSDNITNLKNGDIIVFNKNSVKYIKRIIASCGDVISYNNGDLYLNNELIVKDIFKNSSSFVYDKSIILNKDEFYVLGDNVYNSIDSKDFGVITKDEIVGVLIE